MHRRWAAVLSALSVVIVTTVVTTGTTFARPRLVAIINAAGDQDAGAEFSARLRAQLNSHPDLAPVRPGELTRALEEALSRSDASGARLDAARSALGRARAALDQLHYDRVLVELQQAEDRLLASRPGREVFRLLAEVAFRRAIVLSRTGLDDEAALELRAAEQLDPRRSAPDPARYRPELVQAHARAQQHLPTNATLRVNAPFDGATVFVNGRQAGTTPTITGVSPGVYYICGIQPGDEVTGARVVVRDGDVETVKLRFAQVTVDDRARFLRHELLEMAPMVPGPGPGAGQDASPERRAEPRAVANPGRRANALRAVTSRPDDPVTERVRRVATLTNAEAVILVGDDGQEHLWAVAYDVRSAESTSWVRVRDQKSEVLLAQLGLVILEVFRPSSQNVLPPSGPELPERRWWDRPTVRAGLALAVIASIVGLSLSQLGGSSTPAVVKESTCCTVSGGF